MILRHTFSILALVICTGVHAQDTASETAESDPIQDAIRAFNNGASSKPNEVTVVLPPAEDESSDKNEEQKPVLITGTPPTDSSLVEGDEPPTDLAPLEVPPQEKRGLNVRVAKIQDNKGKLDASKIRLLSPFPAKPLSEATAGWRIEPSETAPPFTREVEISSGKKVTITIPTHILIPDANGADVFAINEPGFENSLGYTQESTVSAALFNAVESLDRDTQELDHVIDQLKQLLVSLPKTENEVKSASENPKSKEP